MVSSGDRNGTVTIKSKCSIIVFDASAQRQRFGFTQTSRPLARQMQSIKDMGVRGLSVCEHKDLVRSAPRGK